MKQICLWNYCSLLGIRNVPNLPSPVPVRARQPIIFTVSGRTTNIHSDGSFVILKCFGASKRRVLGGVQAPRGAGGGGMEVVSVLCHYRNDSTARDGVSVAKLADPPGVIFRGNPAA